MVTADRLIALSHHGNTLAAFALRVPSWEGGMGDAVPEGDVERPSDPDETIDAAEPAREPAPSSLPRDVIAATRDYPQLVTIARDHYVISGEIAKGGIGRVFEARDLRLGRQVAIKELLPKNRDFARRFEREARVTARLQHPAIIHVYEAGVWPGGEPFYAMPKVSGRSLDKVVAERATLAERLALLPTVIAVADALAYAHNENVIHRDLKPANILVGEFGETVVIDWGLAKELGAPSDPKESMRLRLRASPEETVSGGVVGTPAYMSPEQANGAAVDQRVDVYALGALLYKVLAGVAPYSGETAKVVIELVKAGPPRPVQELVPDAPPELVAIVSKAMARDPDDRYITASSLAQDLKRFETGQLVGAHRYTFWQHVSRFLRRHRITVTVGAVALVVLLVVAVISVQQIVSERNRAEKERTLAVGRRFQLLEEFAREELLRGRPGVALAYLTGAAADGKPTARRGFLIADAMRPFVAELAYHDVGKGQAAVAVSSEGAYVAIAGTNTVSLLTSTDVLVRTFSTTSPTRVVAFDPASTRIAAGGEDGIAYVWKLDGTLVATLTGHLGAITDAVFSPDGRTLVTTGNDATVRFWNLATRQAHVSQCHDEAVVSARYSPDGTKVVTASADTTACVLSADGTIQKKLRGHVAGVNAATWSPDGQYIVTASDDGTARVWNADRGKPALNALSHAGSSTVNVALMTSDRRVITAGSDLGVHIWELPAEIPIDGPAPAARQLKILPGHGGAIITGELSRDEQQLVTGAFDGLAIVWDLGSLQPLGQFEHADVVTAARFVPLLHRLATGSRDGTARLWDTTTAEVPHEPLDSKIRALAVSSTHVLAAGTEDSVVRLIRAGEPDTNLQGHTESVLALAFDARGKRLISAGKDASAFVWDTSTREHVASFGNFAEPVQALALESDDDTLVAVIGTHIELWSVAHTRKLRDLVPPPVAPMVEVAGIALGADGVVAAVSKNGSLVVWDRNGKATGQHDESTPYTSLAFAPDGRSLVVGGLGFAHVWRVDDGKLGKKQFSIEGPTNAVRAVGFTADGSRVITAGDDGRAQLWDAEKGKQLGIRGSHGQAVTAIAVDGDTLWVASGDSGALGAWDIHVERESAADLDEFMKNKHILEHLDHDDVVRPIGAQP
ncbi:MAG TPA: protein kinase [Kofleriaceae bacterium]|nr:protein kinase [Kofleriaceae bacterium]